MSYLIESPSATNQKTDSNKRVKNSRTSRSNVTCFSSLPLEIIELILKKLPERNVLTFFLTNRAFKVLTEPSFIKCLFSIYFPAMNAMVEKETPELKNSQSHEELIRQIALTQLSLCSTTPGKFFVIKDAHPKNIKFLVKSNDHTTFASVCLKRISLWNKEGKPLGFQNLSSSITDIAIVQGLVYTICSSQKLEIHSPSDKAELELRYNFQISGDCHKEISSIGFIFVFKEGPIKILRNFEMFEPDFIIDTERFPVKKFSKDHIIFHNPTSNQFFTFKFILEGNPEKPTLKQIEIKNSSLEKTVDDKLFEVSEKERLYCWSDLNTECWDLKTGEKVSSLPKSVFPPLLTQGKIVICHENKLRILDESTQEVIAEEILSSNDALILQTEIWKYKNSNTLIKSIEFMDSWILSKKFVIYLPNPFTKNPSEWKLFTNRTLEGISHLIDFPNGVKVEACSEEPKNIYILKD